MGCCVGGPAGSVTRIDCTGCAGVDNGAAAVGAGRGVSRAAGANASSDAGSPQAVSTTAVRMKMVATMALTGVTYLSLASQ